MPGTGPDPYNHALHTANSWLADVSAAFGTGDRRFCQRALRVWLHTLRDRLTVDAAAKFAAQLPELLRGVYYDGWEPNKVPVKFGADEYAMRFAREAGISPAETPIVAATITQVVGEHMSPGQLQQSLAELPVDLRAMVTGSVERRPVVAAAVPSRTAVAGTAHASPPADPAERVDRIEDQVDSLTEAVRTLAHGLENGRLAGLDEGHVSRAARLADEILIAAGDRR